MILPKPAILVITAIGLVISTGCQKEEAENNNPSPQQTQIEAPEPELQPILRSQPTPPISAPVEVVEAPTSPEPVTEPTPQLLAVPHTLNQSDNQARELVDTLAPTLIQWLLPEQQIRKWVATIDHMAEGNYPRKYPAIDYPLSKFEVQKKDEKTFLAEPSNTHRATPLIETLTGIDPQKIANYYHHWQPIFDKAYRELGKPGDFHNRVLIAIDKVIALEALPENVELVQPHVFYQYKDPTLEKRSDLEKLIWRLGTDNQRALQAYLKELRPYLSK